MKFNFLWMIVSFILVFSSAITSAGVNKPKEQNLNSSLQRQIDILETKLEATKANLELRYDTEKRVNDRLSDRLEGMYKNIFLFSSTIIGIFITIGTGIAYNIISKNIKNTIETETENERKLISAKILQMFGNNCESLYKDIDSIKHPLLHMSYIDISVELAEYGFNAVSDLFDIGKIKDTDRLYIDSLNNEIFFLSQKIFELKYLATTQVDGIKDRFTDKEKARFNIRAEQSIPRAQYLLRIFSRLIFGYEALKDEMWWNYKETEAWSMMCLENQSFEETEIVIQELLDSPVTPLMWKESVFKSYEDHAKKIGKTISLTVLEQK